MLSFLSISWSEKIFQVVWGVVVVVSATITGTYANVTFGFHVLVGEEFFVISAINGIANATFGFHGIGIVVIFVSATVTFAFHFLVGDDATAF